MSATVSSLLVCSRCENAPKGEIDGSVSSLCSVCANKIWVPLANQDITYTLLVCVQCYEEAQAER